MDTEHVVIINDPQNDTGRTQLRVGDKIALQSMPLRPFTITRIFAGGDSAQAGGKFPKGGVIMVSARQLASAFLVERPQPKLDFDGGLPPRGCSFDVFKPEYIKLGGNPSFVGRTHDHYNQGHDILSAKYATTLINAGYTAPFAERASPAPNPHRKDASSDEGAQPAPVNDDTQVDDEQLAEDAESYEAWLAQQSA